VLTIPLSVFFKFLPEMTGIEPIPFLNRMMWVFLICMALMIAVSLIWPKGENKAIEANRAMYKVSTSFIICSVIILGILSALYIVFW
jgi:SSS family solute:Na+ symporter